MTQMVFVKNESEISLFFDNNSFIGKFEQKRVGRSAHKKSESVQHTKIYLLGLKLQYKHKTKLP